MKSLHKRRSGRDGRVGGTCSRSTRCTSLVPWCRPERRSQAPASTAARLSLLASSISGICGDAPFYGEATLWSWSARRRFVGRSLDPSCTSLGRASWAGGPRSLIAVALAGTAPPSLLRRGAFRSLSVGARFSLGRRRAGRRLERSAGARARQLTAQIRFLDRPSSSRVLSLLGCLCRHRLLIALHELTPDVSAVTGQGARDLNFRIPCR